MTLWCIEYKKCFFACMTLIYFSYVTRRKFLHKNLYLGFSKYNLKSWSIVFFGSDSFSLAHLKCLHEQLGGKLVSGLEVVVVNEANPVHKYAVAHNLKTHTWPPNLNGSYDLGVIASFGKFIPENILVKFQLGILNVHGSLLPRWRGGMPVAHAIINGDTSTGVTVTRIRTDKWDAGEIIMQKTCAIGKNEVIPSLMRRLSDLGVECLKEVLHTLPDCLRTSIPQLEEEATFAPKLKSNVAVINWKDMRAIEVFNLFRGLFGTYELKSSWKGSTVKFMCLSLGDNDQLYLRKESCDLEPGSFTYGRKSGFLIVQCKEKFINVCSLKYKGKLHTGHSFYTGYLHKCPKSEWKFGN